MGATTPTPSWNSFPPPGSAFPGPATSEIMRMPEVVLEVTRTSQFTEDLHRVIGELEARLNGVTRGGEPSGETGGPIQLPPAAPLAQTLATANEGLTAAHRRLADLLQRLEV